MDLNVSVRRLLMTKKVNKEGAGVASTEGGTGGLNLIEPTLTNTAFSVIKTGEKKYAVVSMKFNPETKETGEYTVLTGDVDFYEAQHVFRTTVIKSGILS